MSRPSVYLAGPMRHYPAYNFPAFDAYKAALEEKGYDVTSPADLDREQGFDPSNEVTPKLIRDIILRDCQAICKVDMVVLMPGWENSSGVKVEKALAEFLAIPVKDLRELWTD